jgi:Fe-S cluster assembly protein SufD
MSGLSVKNAERKHDSAQPQENGSSGPKGGVMMSTMMAEQNVYSTQFSTILELLPGGHLPWVTRLRKGGMENFLALGLPTTKLENWKYTNVAPIRRITFEPPPDRPIASIPESLQSQVNSFASPRLVFVNGRLDQALSLVEGGASSHLVSLSEALADKDRAPAVEMHLGRYAITSEHAFAAWNTAFFTDGAYIEIPRGTVFEHPINLVFVSIGTGEPWACYPRNLIVLGEGSQVTFVEAFLGLDGLVYLTNAVTEIAVGPGAVVEYYKMECESSQGFHIAAINAHLDRDASLTSHSISFGGALVRNDLNVALGGEGAHTTLSGLFAVDGQRLVDNHTHIDHQKPHASSREMYKGVLSGKAEGVFNGTITVRENAQKTDAVQYSKNLLLSKQAQINTKPQLEIRNNDVRCFHGATIGQLDPEAIFYLKSRGIGEDRAKQILVQGFVEEIIDGIHVPSLRNQLESFLTEWLKGALEA